MECGSLRGLFEAVPVKIRLGRSVGLRSVAMNFELNQGAVQFQRRTTSSGNHSRRSFHVKAAGSTESNKCEFRHGGSPLEPHSQAGMFLNGILQNQPHVLHVAATELLEELASDRNGVVARQERSLGSSEACLHRRIAEMKEVEYQTAVEEVMYMLVVREFSKIKVPLVPRLSEFTTSGRIEMWPNKDRELESIHSPQVLELVKEHLSNVLGREGKYGRIIKWSIAQISRLQLGRIYAASIMYGYFLMAASVRHRLEHRIAVTDERYPLGFTVCVPHLDRQMSNLEVEAEEEEEEEAVVVVGRPFDAVSSFSPGLGKSRKPKDLKSYVMEFDPKSVQLCAKLRSEAASNVIENHSLAIFGDGDISNLVEEDDIMVSVTFSGLKRLVLEAVAFGTFLWDAEELVRSVYPLREESC